MIKSPEIFVVSSGRSGTTLLVSMLNASQQIYFPYESDFLARAFPFYKKNSSFTVDDYIHLIELFLLCSQPSGWGVSKQVLLDYCDEHRPQSLAEIFSIFCLAFHESNQTQNLLWGIKCPVLIASLKEIIDLYPNSKIVHIVRDGRDVYLSYKDIHEKSAIKFGPNGIIQTALYWIDGLRQVEDFQDHDQLLELKYESLLQNPEHELRRLSKFLNILYTPDMHENFNVYVKNKNLTPAKLNSNIHSNLVRKIDASNVEKFREKMSQSEQYIFELIAAPYLHKYGYKTSYHRLIIFKPLQIGLYSLSRLFNNWRYFKRSQKNINQVDQDRQSS